MLIENGIDEPDTVPDTVPRPVTPVLVSVIVTVPENEVLVCVSCQDIWPGPDESDAEPLHVPVTFAGDDVCDGWVGVVVPPPPPPPPPHATADMSAIAASALPALAKRGTVRVISIGTCSG
jgi:hypothetical protein